MCENAEGRQTGHGRIDGQISRDNRGGLEGVTVLLNETTKSAITGATGHFAFDNVPPGTYSLTITLGERTLTIQDVVVTEGNVTTIDEVIDWDRGFTEALTVVATSRRTQRIVEAPGSITKVTAAEIADQAAHGLLPKLVEFAPGVQLTQGGVYDYNLNARGFNSSLNRRVAVLIDGRNPAAAFFGAQEWSAVGFPLDDLASVEFVRGPSAALYGANASSGVLNMVTKDPRSARGGLVRATFGQLDTINVDFRLAGALGKEWYGKVVGGIRQGGDFFISRRGAAEYSVPCRAGLTTDCLPQEVVVPPRVDDNDVYLAAGRLDRYFSRGLVATMEGGLSHVAGPVVQTGVNRTQITEVSRPWARFNLNMNHGNVFVAYTGRDAPGQLALASGVNTPLTSHTLQFEGQTDRSFKANRVAVVLGASAVIERIDSFDDELQRQTLLFEPIEANQQAIFGQIEWKVAGPLQLVFAGRGDFSSLHSFQFSPKLAAVYSLSPRHSVRVTYNEAFQVPNYSEFFLQTDAAPQANLTSFNAFCAPFGVDCRFGPTRVLALGNSDLQLEESETIETGYKGRIAGRAFVTLDYYWSRNSNFVTDLLPQLSTPLGRINPNYGPWQAPAGLPDAVAAQIRAAVPSLSNNIDGSNILAVASYTNFGRVDTQGVDISLDYTLAGGWRCGAAFSWFDFNMKNSVEGLEAVVLPNSPEHTGSATVSYARGPLDAGLSMRWVDGFRWSAGVFQGDVPSYTSADLFANYRLPRGLIVGVSVANLFDDEHWESFGGDILRRRALVSAGYAW